jgi:hypothetical protein
MTFDRKPEARHGGDMAGVAGDCDPVLPGDGAAWY